MNMRLIYGRAGTGKSEFILREIKEQLKSRLKGTDPFSLQAEVDERGLSPLVYKAYIIVPEQFSYATEKRLLETLGDASIKAEVISFKRLAHRVFSEVGGINETNLSKTGKTMLVKYILEKNKKDLNFLGKNGDIDLILRTITELKKHCVGKEILEEQIKKTDDEYLKLKLKDINTIYTKYEQAILNNYIDEDDVLTILANKINKSKMLDNSKIYIDEFSGFTEQEYNIIEEILKKAEQVNITISADNLKKEKAENDIFYSNKQVANKLIKITENCRDELCSPEIEEPIKLEQSYRFKNEELKHLEKNIYSNIYEKYDKEINHIHLEICSNPYTEIERLAKKIIKLVRDNGLRYRDISVLTKNIEEYTGAISAIFPKFDIPVFIDNNKELNDNILVKYVLSIFEVFAKNWSSDSVWSYIKTGFIDIERKDLYALENYCRKWGIRGNKWYKEDWNYDSLTIDLETLNELRRKIVNPLINLKNKIDEQKTAKEITVKLYEFLEENSIRQKLEDKIQKLSSIEQIKYANEYSSSWNILMDILDEVNLVFGNQKMTFEDYREILKSGLEVSAFGEIPQMIDQVIVGDVERSRNHKVHTLFILGLNDGVFPNTNFAEGFLNDKDREYLKENGIELAKGTLENIYEDRFNIYKAFTTAENDIYLSYVSSDKEGKAIRPSTLITKIKKIFPKLIEKSSVLENETDITMPKDTFGGLLVNIRNSRNGEELDDIWKATYNWYIKNEEWKEKLLKAIKGYENKTKAEKISDTNIQRLYGNILKTSVSRLEQYRRCPFSFHLKYGLKLKEKEDLEIKPIDTGSFMHDIIDTFFDEVKEIKNITDEEIEKIVNQIINEKLELSRNYIFRSTPKFIVLTNRLKKVILQSIKYIVYQIQNGDFEILENELEFKKKIDNVEITGKIDRLDAVETEKGKFIRIIDYKSSDKNIDLNELVSGTQIQLITYLDSMTEKEEAKPAAMLYFSLIDPVIKSSKNKSDEEIKEELKKKFRMNGMILADIDIIKKMDKTLEKGSSASIPVYLDKDGNISKSRSNTVTKDEFTRLQKTAEKVIKQIAKEILEGSIDIKPAYYKKNKIDTCKYCEYKSICGFNPKVHEYLYIENKSKDEVLEMINTEN